MKADDSRPVNTGEEESGRNSEGALYGAETDVTARRRTNAEWEREGKLMAAVCERSNLWLAYDRVTKNKGAAGVDGVGVNEFKEHLKQHWPTIKAKLLAGEYIPSPVRRVDIPKPQGGVRTLGIPTLTDRLIQQAIHQSSHRSSKRNSLNRATDSVRGEVPTKRSKLQSNMWPKVVGS